MTEGAREEYAGAMRPRYSAATKAERGRLVIRELVSRVSALRGALGEINLLSEWAKREAGDDFAPDCRVAVRRTPRRSISS